MGSTLKIVAEKAGVSIVTASRVFNGVDTVKPAFRKRVFAAAKALNYTPNLLARGLAKNSLKIVSVHMGDLENPYFGRLATSLTKEFSRHGYEMIICESVAKTIELNRSLATTGSILVSVGNREILERIADTHSVLGICCTFNDNINMPNIDLDFSSAYNDLFEKAVNSGKNKIAVLSNLLQVYPHLAETKFKHVYSAMEKNGLSLVENRVFADADSIVSIMEKEPEAVNCIFCENDIEAVTLYGKLARAGLRIPEDVAVVGCDGTLVLDGMWSIMIDTRKIAAKAFDIFGEFAANGVCSERHVIKPEAIY